MEVSFGGLSSHMGLLSSSPLSRLAACSSLLELPRRQPYWTCVDRAQCLHGSLPGARAAACSMQRAQERRSLTEGSVVAHKSQAQGLGSCEEHSPGGWRSLEILPPGTPCAPVVAVMRSELCKLQSRESLSFLLLW